MCPTITPKKLPKPRRLQKRSEFVATPALLAMMDANCHPAPAGKTREIITSMLVAILFKKMLSLRGCADVAQRRELAPCTQVFERRDGVCRARAALPVTGTWNAKD
mmetsp:Transcript_2337/g.7099  ORF Transcript_2337/g.7099 Transcript_2337/m.7099 type:complete len:106 (+) Transcript_2337:651-968(+)